MPSKAYVQLLQRLYIHFMRNSGRNKPDGIADVSLVDDDDLTRWFVQLRYTDENNAPFYVSVELVFSEEGAEETEEAAAAAAVATEQLHGPTAGATRLQQRPPRQVGPSASAVAMATTARLHGGGGGTATEAAASSPPPSPPQQQQQQTSPSSSLPAASRPAVEAAAGSGGASDARPGRPHHGTAAAPAATAAPPAPPDTHATPSPAVASAAAAAAASSPPAPARRGLVARMPLVFIVAPRLVASFIHHGALCSLELMAQHWEPTPENMALLFMALLDTLNPFAGDGRVTVEEAERVESRREAAIAAGGRGGVGAAASSSCAAAYTGEEHMLGLDYIRRAHPHLFRRYVGPRTASSVDMVAAAPSHTATTSSSNSAVVAAGDGGAGIASPGQHRHRSGLLGDGPTAAAAAAAASTSSSASVSPAIAATGAPTATATPSAAAPAVGTSVRGSATAHTLRDVPHLNTAVYDALVATYAPQPPPPPVVLLLDSPALLADADGGRLLPRGVRGVQEQQQQQQSAAASADAGHTEDDGEANTSSGGGSTNINTTTTAAAAVAAPPSPPFAPASSAERVLRERPPARSHVAYAPTQWRALPASARPHDAEKDKDEPPQQQRVAELWIPLALPPPPPPPPPSGVATSVQAVAAEAAGVTHVLRLADDGTGSGDAAPAPHALEVHLVGDAVDHVRRAPVACVLRNMRVSVAPARRWGGDPHVGGAAPLRFSLQSSTAPSPGGDVHACVIPPGLTLHCQNMFLYGHLRILGRLVLENCVFVGSMVVEELASVHVSRSELALMPDDRLLLFHAPPSRGGGGVAASARPRPRRRRRRPRRHSHGEEAAVESGPGSPPPPQPQPPPALFYAHRRECVLVLDSSRVEVCGDTHIYRLMPESFAAAAAAAGGAAVRRERRVRDTSTTAAASADNDASASSSGGSSGSSSDVDDDTAGTPATSSPPPVAAMMTVLRSLLLVSNQGHLRLVRCTVHPGRHTERTISAEQDAVVDVAYCTITAAISSAVSVQGCRAHLERCLLEGNTAADANDSGGDRRRPPPVRVSDATRCTGLNVELGGTLTARHCTARHLYFAFCVIAHSVAHLYRCHATEVVNGFTIDASAATLDGCSAHTNHVGVFALRGSKCVLTDDSCGSFPRRCSLLGEAHEAARRTVLAEQQQQQQQRGEGAPRQRGGSPIDALWASATAVADSTARVAQLARRYYAERLPRSGTLSDAATAAAVDDDHGEHPRDYFGGRFSLEVRDAALKATAVTLVNAHDTSVYVYENASVELVECVLWSTVEAVDAANAAAATVAAALGSEDALVRAAAGLQRGSADEDSTNNNNGDDDGGGGGGTSPRRRVATTRQRSCGVKVVHASLKAWRCLVSGYSFGIAAIHETQAELESCIVLNAVNGYTVDESRCHLRHCGADTAHVGIFALNGSRVVAEGTPHVVGVGACGRTPPPLLCGGVPAVYGGDVYGLECQASEMTCTGITVLRGRDCGFNAYNGSELRLHKCLVAMSPTDAASYVFQQPSTAAPLSSAAAAAAAAAGDGTAGSWTRHLRLDRPLSGAQDRGGVARGGSDAEDASNSNDAGVDHEAAAAAAAPVAAARPSITAGRATPAVRTSGVKVWSGSRCYAYDTEVRCATFGFASLGPSTVLEAHRCAAKHVVNGFTSDGGALRLIQCSASSNHVGVYVLSHAHCVVQRGSYTAKKYGIECRSGVLTLQGHVRLHGFSRIGLYLYDGAHCEADADCVLDIHAVKHTAPSLASLAAAATTSGASATSVGPQQQQQQQPSSTVSTASLCGPEDATNVADLLPACIALDEATAQLPQVVLGGGARCGITCGDGATGYIGKCIVHDCTVVGVNVFSGAHLTLANALVLCAQQYAVVVHVGGVCRILRTAGGDDDDTGEEDVSEEGDDGDDGEGGGSGARDKRRRGSRGVGAAVQAAVRRLFASVTRVTMAPWRAALQWESARQPRSAAPSSQPQPTASTGPGGRRPSSAVVAATAAAAAAATASLQRSSAAASSRRRATARCAMSALSADAAPPAALDGGAAAAAAAADDRDDGGDIGGHRVVAPSRGRSSRRRLRWLRTAPLVTAGAATAPAAAAAAGPASTSADATPAISSVALPAIARPVLCGSCVVRGSCAMERVVLRPTSHMPWRQACPGRGGGRGGERRDGESVACTDDDDDDEDKDATDADGRVSPSVPRVAQRLLRQSPGIHVCQQGVLSLVDSVLDASLAAQPHLGDAAPSPSSPRPPVTAIITCEGPYARLHLDHVRVTRDAADDAEDVAAACEGRCGAAAAAATTAAAWATVPLLLLSLLDGAQGTVHMVGTALGEWPFDDGDGDGDGDDGGAATDAAAPLSLVRLDAARNVGVMLRATGDALAELTYTSLSAVLASQRAMVRLEHSTVVGTSPITLGSGGFASLMFCRVIGGLRAGPASPAARVVGDGELSLYRSSVWTLSAGAAVECVDGGTVRAIESEQESLVACEELLDGSPSHDGSSALSPSQQQQQQQQQQQ
ncbi:hypothetical protein NESM_000624400 [Novymonas esmeraldas]|uniref:Right handed beta helix domain-containing protein n=1 Tax=Novymonas esmeraldas TaxID=1808958 RepID=A0AAW0ETS4_9TRYP